MSILAILAVAFMSTRAVHAAQTISFETPIDFFTNVAGCLLKNELQTDISRIQIYPENQYTPGVHRVLQLTANVYDAATNRPATGFPFLPSVFRPVFSSVSNEVYIAGYEETTNTEVLSETFRDLTNPQDRAGLQPHDMVYGIPLIVGVKKGYPNFNEFGLVNDIRVTRHLEFRKDVPYGPITTTNQIYTLSISNTCGVEAWNSYTSTFPRDLKLTVTGDIIINLTNEFGQTLSSSNGCPISNVFSFSATTNIAANTWSGFVSPLSAISFITPVITSSNFLAESMFSFLQRRFSETNNDFPNFFPIPHWWLNLGVRLRFTLVDTNVDRLVDYANLCSEDPPLDITDWLKSGGSCSGFSNPTAGDLFCTNRLGGQSDQHILTYGLFNQINISLGAISVSDAFWHTYNAELNDRETSIVQFQRYVTGADQSSTSFNAPFRPLRTIHQNLSWQANDPLVHFTTSDLIDGLWPGRTITLDSDAPVYSALQGLGTLNRHYRPWGGSPLILAETIPPSNLKLEIKDPLIKNSDAWQFPDGNTFDLQSLGQIHRGTPWQTIYLKSAVAESNLWASWSGVRDGNEAKRLHPTNDWRIAPLLISLLTTKDPRNLLSVNSSDASDWRQALDGIPVLTNSVPFFLVMGSNSPQADFLATAVLNAQAARPNRFIQYIGDLLSVPELTVSSPWLDLARATTTIPDSAYEAIPTGLLPRLRPDSVATLLGSAPSRIEFSGFDQYRYGVQTSSNLVDWISVSTNCPTNGTFEYIDPISTDGKFYRCLLLR